MKASTKVALLFAGAMLFVLCVTVFAARADVKEDSAFAAVMISYLRHCAPPPTNLERWRELAKRLGGKDSAQTLANVAAMEQLRAEHGDVVFCGNLQKMLAPLLD